MFTGIIEEVGNITSIDKAAVGIKLTVAAEVILDDIKLGDSISISGACQTVVDFTGKQFTVEVSPETMRVTTFNAFKPGDKVNLERALKLSDRLGGHLVSGHVDGVGELVSVKDEGISRIYTFTAPHNVAKYIIYKGSICINGISLTVSNIKDNGTGFSVAIIPHTLEKTNLLNIKVGQQVNLESDIVAKYIEKFLMNRECDIPEESNITYEFLAKHGFM